MANDLLNRRERAFVLWSPHQPAAAPTLVIGKFQEGTPPTVAEQQRFDLTSVAALTGLWSIAAGACGLDDGDVYHYWFEVDNTLPGNTTQRILVCDPFAFTVDWRVAAANQPAAVIKFTGGRLAACDPEGAELAALQSGDGDIKRLPANNQMVIYELPTAWSRQPGGGNTERAVGTFRDILAMVDRNAAGANFSDLRVTAIGNRYLVDLGVNAVELLPPADSIFDREWGYGTSHFLAPDFELGFPEEYSWPTANQDLQKLAEAFHQNGIRLFDDAVLGFAREGPHQHISFDEFHIQFDPQHPPDDPDVWSSRAGQARQDWGSKLFRYVRQTNNYDPTDGVVKSHPVARAFMYTYLARWMSDFQLDGLRLDSIETVANWDFVGTFAAHARQSFRERAQAQGVSQSAADARFLVVGEELSLPLDIIRQGRVDALWNDNFRKFIRAALFGNNADGEPSFEWTVRKGIDCKLLGFTDSAQAVNYITSHDVEGPQKERLCTSFRYANFGNDDIARRVKLGFACLITAVGIPMFLAGEEFADENDLFDIHGNVSNNSGKQIDPVDFSRLEGDENAWRRDVRDVVARLIKLRTSHAAPGRNECDFIHTDFTPGRRVMAWKRGLDSDPVVVVANFSDFASAGNEYRVNNWPQLTGGRHWREITQDRAVPDDWAGRESLFPWEAKVYVMA
jgi:pullulanase